MACSLSMRGSFQLRVLFFSVAVLLLAPASAVDDASSVTPASGEAAVEEKKVISDGEAPAQVVEPTSYQIDQPTAAPVPKSDTVVAETKTVVEPPSPAKVEEQAESAKPAVKKEEPPKVAEKKEDAPKVAVKKEEPPKVAEKKEDPPKVAVKKEEPPKVSVVPTDHKGKIEAHLSSVENAKKIGLEGFKVDKLATEGQRLAKEYLAQVANGPIDDLPADWSKATHLATRAGVPPEAVAEVFKTVKAKLHELYVDAVSKIVKSSFNGTQETVHHLGQIAQTLHIWRKLQVGDDEEDVQSAKAFLRDIVKQAFEKGDLAFTRAAFDLAKKSKADTPEVKEDWLELYEEIENLYPHTENHPLKQLVGVVNKAAKAKLPKTEHLTKIQNSCQNQTLANLRSLDGKSIKEILGLIKDAREADVSPSSYELSSAEAKTRTMAIAGIDKLINENASLTELDVDPINIAFQVAWETGVDSSIVDEKSAALQAKLASKMKAATTLLDANRTVARMKAVADFLRVWKDLTASLPTPNHATEEVPKKARDVFTSQLESAIDGMEMTYVVEGGRLVDYANVKCCPRARQWADVDGIIEGLVSPIRAGAHVQEEYLLSVVIDAKACNYPSTLELQEVKSHLSVVSQAKLANLLSGNTDIKKIVQALKQFKEQRRAVSGSEVNRSSAEVDAEKRVRDHLNQTLGEAMHHLDGTEVGIALDYAKKAELPATEIQQAWDRVKQDLRSKLSAITNAADASATSRRTSSVSSLGSSGVAAVDYAAGSHLEDLSRALQMWRKLSLDDHEDVLSARAAIERHIKAGYAARDPDFIVSAHKWISTSKHDFKEGAEIQHWARTYSQVKEVCDHGLENQKTTNLLELREEARKHGILEVGHGATLDTFLKKAIDSELSKFA